MIDLPENTDKFESRGLNSHYHGFSAFSVIVVLYPFGHENLVRYPFGHEHLVRNGKAGDLCRKTIYES
ncbi:hypothetical protein J7L48_09180 [bacterium]|nr:hypothetical protein [bacterium]